MKNLITTIACLMILLVFVFQFASNQVAHSRMLFAEAQVNTFVETAKQDGCVTTANKNTLKNAISAKFGCTGAEVIVSGTASKVQRGETITYSVSYPIKGIIGAASFWGLSDSENTAQQTIQGTTTSEYVSWN